MINVGTTVSLLAASGVTVATVGGEVLTAYDKLGVVALLLLAVGALYKDGVNRQKKFEDVLERTITAITTMTDVAKKCQTGDRK